MFESGLTALKRNCVLWLSRVKGTDEEMKVTKDLYDKCQLVNQIVKLFRKASAEETKDLGLSETLWESPTGVRDAIRRINCLFQGT